jgi:hypothetical protein
MLRFQAAVGLNVIYDQENASVSILVVVSCLYFETIGRE